MKITAITRYKHAEIYGILRRLGWSQSELARRTGISPQDIGRIINLRQRPKIEQADRIQQAFGEAGEFLDVLSTWPETFQGLPAGFVREETAEVDTVALETCPEALQLPAPSAEEDPYQEDREVLAKVLPDLDERDQTLLDEWNNEETLSSLGDKYRVHKATIDQRINRTLRRIRRKISEKKARWAAGTPFRQELEESAILQRAIDLTREQKRRMDLDEAIAHFKNKSQQQNP